MAKFKSIVYAEIRGKVNGLVYSRNRFAAYARNKTSPVQPRTPSVMLRRQVLTNLAREWRELSDTDRAEWIQFASQLQRTNTLGDVIQLTGLQVFILYNATRALFGLNKTTAPPPTVEQPPALTSVTLDINPSTLEMNVDFTPTPYAGGLIIRATRPVSQGRTFVGPSDFRVVQAVPGPSIVAPVDIWSPYTDRFGIPPPGTRVFVEVVPVMWGSSNAAQGGLQMTGVKATALTPL